MLKKRMNLSKILILLALLISIIFIFLAIINKSANTGFLVKEENIRKPVFAGTWYPSDARELKNTINLYIYNSKNINFNGEIKALIVPHAGYAYSGQIAGDGFRQLQNREYKNIFILGTSHRYYLTNVSASNFEYFSTPLGEIKVSKKSREMEEKEEIISIIEEAHKQEHSIEVELPFLQEVLEDFQIIPLIVGESNSNELKEVLTKYLGEEDLIVVSADLSHYHEYNQALITDAYTIKNILELNSEEVLNSEIDSPWGVASLLEIAKEKSWKPYLIAYANSGDITGNKTSVVGYGAIVFVDEKYEKESYFTEEEREFMLNLARESAEEYLKKGKTMELNEKEVPERLKENKACFVTFTENNQLRGCIGHILPQKPLYECIIENSINAAIKDTRFSPVIYDEMKNIRIDISILSVPVKLEYSNPEELLSKLKTKEHGVIIQRDSYQSTFLPSVWEFIPNKKEFLANLCVKAGMEGECWTDQKTQIYFYTAEDFSE